MNGIHSCVVAKLLSVKPSICHTFKRYTENCVQKKLIFCYALVIKHFVGFFLLHFNNVTLIIGQFLLPSAKFIVNVRRSCSAHNLLHHSFDRNSPFESDSFIFSRLYIVKSIKCSLAFVVC